MSENGKAGPHAPFDQEVDVRVLYIVGGILVGVCLAVYLLVWGLLHLYEGRDQARGRTNNPLLRSDNRRDLQQRVESIEGPRLEGLQPEENKLLLETVTGANEVKQEWFYIPRTTYIEEEGERVPLYNLRVGTRVKLAYWQRDQRHVATTIIAPPPQPKKEQYKEQVSFATGKIVRIEPLTISGWREWATVRKGGYGWTDVREKIAHIPVDQAMQSVLQTEEFQKAGKTKEPLPWLDRATSSSSGQSAREEQR